MYLIFFSIIICQIVIILISFCNTFRSTKDLINPVYIFNIALFLYGNIGFYAKIDNTNYTDFTKLIYLISLFLGLLSFNIGYYIVAGEKITRRYFNYKKKLKFLQKSSYFLIVFLFFIFTFLNHEKFLYMITNFGSGLSYTLNAARPPRTVLSGPLSFLEDYFTYIFTFLPFYRIYFLKKVSILDFFLYSILIVYSLASGARGTIIFIVLQLVVLINYRFSYIKIMPLILITTLLLLFSVSLAHLRNKSTVDDMINMLINSNKKTDLINPLKAGEFSGPTGVFFDYIESINDGETQFDLGKSYLIELSMFIPNFIYHSRPLPPAEQYMKDFYPNAPPGTGKAWFILVDGYNSFAFLGIVIEMLLFGMLISKIYNYFCNNSNNGFILYLYATLLLYLIFSIRGSSLGIIKNYMLYIIPLYSVYLICYKLKN